MTNPKVLEQAIEAAADWLNLDGVYLVGEGEKDGEPCIVVHASTGQKAIPHRFQGFPVVLEKDTEPTAQ